MDTRALSMIGLLAGWAAMTGCADYHDQAALTGDDDDGWYGDDDVAGDDDDGPYGDDDDTPPEDWDDELLCDDVPADPTTLYLSADDSNSMAAPALARQLIEQGVAIHGGMRPYEFLNYYDFYYPPAPAGHVRIDPQVADNGDGTYTMLIGVAAPSITDVARRPRSLTFSVDSSGSMIGHPLETTKDVLVQIAHNLQPGDVVSLLAWDSSVTVPLQGEVVEGPDDPDLLAAIHDLNSGGSTDLHGGLVRAYQLAEAAYEPDRLNRVILISDGGANVGVVDEDLIASHSDDAEAEGIYMVGIGIDDDAYDYSDSLMDTVTDAGKGAYVYIDDEDEAAAMFGDDERFLSVMEVAARAVQVEMIMPAGYVMEEFHGEEYSEDPDEVEPQHLAPGDAMLFHQILADCTQSDHDGSETFAFTVTWTDPATREARTDTVTMTMAEMIDAAGPQLRKSDVVVAYAEALVDVWDLEPMQRGAYIGDVLQDAETAYLETGDADLREIADLLGEYRSAQFGY
jgi:Ca-activated chloride channel homolog